MPNKGYKPTEIHRKKVSEGRKRFLANNPNPRLGKKHSEEAKKRMSLSRTGFKMPLEQRRKLSEMKKGSKSHFWKGGVSLRNKILRDGVEYKLWREAVFKKDNYTCVWCNQRGGNLNADHIKPFAYFPELRFAIDNGRTLCVPCHRTTFKEVFKYRQSC